MASVPLSQDWRFAKPASYTQAHVDDDDDEDDEPIFGSSSSSSSSSTDRHGEHTGNSSSQRRAFDEKDYAAASAADGESSDMPSGSGAPASGSGSTDTELYAILNLDKECSTEDVLRSYRSLAVAFHPDKHRDPALKEAAQNRFEKVQHAYEVLHNQHTRAVYDLFGEEGLKSNWEVGQKLKSPEELRAELEKNRLKRAQTDIENLIRSKTEANITLDASPYIDHSSNFFQALASIPSADVRQLYMKASTVSILSPSTTISYSGTMLARRNQGGGNVLATLRHQYSPRLALEAGATLLAPKRGTLKAHYAISQDEFASIDAAILTPTTLPPFNMVYGRSFFKTFTGFVKFSSGTSYSIFHPLVPTSLLPNVGTPSALTVGASGSAYSVEVTTNQFAQLSVSGNYGDVRVLGGGKQHGWKVSTNVGATNQGNVTLGVTTEKRLTENTHVSIGLNVVATSGALTLRLRVTRLGQKLNVPILLSRGASPKMILGTVVVPAISIASIQYFYLTPQRRKRTAKKLAELRAEQSEQTGQKRREALEAVELLREQVERKREAEKSKNGLVILEATYAGAPSRTTDEKDLETSVLDVTIPLQALVTSRRAATANGREEEAGSALIIPGGRSKAQLIGFYDVLVGGKKRLTVTYTFKGRRHEAIFGDHQAVAIPMQSHLLE